MSALRIGDRVRFGDRELIVTGVTPMSVSPTVIRLTDPQTGEQVDVSREELLRPDGEIPSAAAEEL